MSNLLGGGDTLFNVNLLNKDSADNRDILRGEASGTGVRDGGAGVLVGIGTNKVVTGNGRPVRVRRFSDDFDGAEVIDFGDGITLESSKGERILLEGRDPRTQSVGNCEGGVVAVY